MFLAFKVNDVIIGGKYDHNILLRSDMNDGCSFFQLPAVLAEKRRSKTKRVDYDW